MAYLEIFIAMLAAFGLWCIFNSLKQRLLFPGRIMRRLRCALFAEGLDDDTLRLCESYAASLALQGKISRERLIILAKDDIMNDRAMLAASLLKRDGHPVYYYKSCEDVQRDGERKGADRLHRDGGGRDISE